MTVSGPKPDKPCIFPFKYDGKIFKTCTYYDYDVGEDQAWCATKVDSSGNYIYGDTRQQENWGNCGPKCPIPG